MAAAWTGTSRFTCPPPRWTSCSSDVSTWDASSDRRTPHAGPLEVQGNEHLWGLPWLKGRERADKCFAFRFEAGSSEMLAVGAQKFLATSRSYRNGQSWSTSLGSFPSSPFTPCSCSLGSISHINQLCGSFCLRTWHWEKLSWDRG